ncbi:protein FAR1-RELATED SEQUENCE 5-like [Bidens hawaiensis]|uniref:protein FAR1-RELATED SEQUENCE 5-like n=1 Tax=Bidens hawaiensis TaxID=980011 RepID=UPI00404A7955
MKVFPGTTPGTILFRVYEFVELHNHALLSTNSMEFSKKWRRLGFTERHFIHKLSLNKIGPNIAHNLQCLLKGGSHNVHGTKTDFKNAARDSRVFITDRDAQMLVDTLKARSENLPNFSFDFKIVGCELRSVFWADDVSKCNYAVFGDVLGFDATYRTNKYGMIFVLFTGVDHHKKCVTCGAGLLYDETIESYKWLLEQFLKSHKTQPKLVLTDQDAATKQAVPAMFGQSVHRLCMWHIVKKIPLKISGDLLSNENLRVSIHKLVWNLFITPSTFEEQWNQLMDGLQLSDHHWLKEIYAIREQWVPCYFREIQWCCLMKTTSRCESSNALFKVNTRKSNTLVQFLLCFGTALDRQQNTQLKLDTETETTTPHMQQKLPIEIHASRIHTRRIFLEVQKEIYRGMKRCYITSSSETDGTKIYNIAHTNKRFQIVNNYVVSLIIVPGTIVMCTCMCYTHSGYLCRHVFCVFQYNQIVEIPTKYLLARWMRNTFPDRVHDIANKCSADDDAESVIRRNIFDTLTECVDRLRHKTENLNDILARVKDIRDRLFTEFPTEPSCNSKRAIISELIGQLDTVDVLIKPPTGIKNKGSGTKRQVGVVEQLFERRNKNPRLCGKCNKYVFDHDARNIEKVQAAKEAAAAVGTDDLSALGTAATETAYDHSVNRYLLRSARRASS